MSWDFLDSLPPSDPIAELPIDKLERATQKMCSLPS